MSSSSDTGQPQPLLDASSGTPRSSAGSCGCSCTTWRAAPTRATSTSTAGSDDDTCSPTRVPGSDRLGPAVPRDGRASHRANLTVVGHARPVPKPRDPFAIAVGAIRFSSGVSFIVAPKAAGVDLGFGPRRQPHRVAAAPLDGLPGRARGRHAAAGRPHRQPDDGRLVPRQRRRRPGRPHRRHRQPRAAPAEVRAPSASAVRSWGSRWASPAPSGPAAPEGLHQLSRSG